MAQIRYLWLLGVFTLVLAVSCSLDSRHRKSRGVQVGNGMQSYYSEEYKFQLDYESRYQLQIQSHSNFMFYNTVAKMQVDIDSHPTIKNEESLRKVLRDKYSSFSEVKLEDVWAYLADETYFLFSPNKKELMKFTMSGDAESKKALAVALGSLKFDYEKPQLKKVTTSHQKIKPGNPITFNFEFDEKKIELSGNMHGKFTAINYEKGKCHHELDFELNLEKENAKEYTATLAIPLNMCVGKYEISRLFVSDKVANTLHLELKDKVYVGAKYPLSKITLEVEGFDKNSQKGINLKSLDLQNSKIQAGNPIVLHLDATNGEEGAPIKAFVRFANKSHKNSFIEFTDYAVYQPGKGYIVRINTEKFLLSGLYQLQNLNLYDKNGNKLLLNSRDRKEIQDIKIDVLTSIEDLVAPEIVSLKVKNPVWEKGTYNRLYFYASDKGSSGLSKRREFRALFVKYAEKKVDKHFTVESKIYTSNVNEYYLEFFVPENLPSGEYILVNFVLSDVAGNTTQLKADESHKFYKSHLLEVVKITLS